MDRNVVNLDPNWAWGYVNKHLKDKFRGKSGHPKRTDIDKSIQVKKLKRPKKEIAI
tara:strand:- start:5212 stop:5379 length:168 start_codon:yes stop_codon:yes gene_type:complete